MVHQLRRNMIYECSSAAPQRQHARFARKVALNHVMGGGCIKAEVVGGEASVGELGWDGVIGQNRALFFHSVASEWDNFHAISQSTVYIGDIIHSGHKSDFGEVNGLLYPVISVLHVLCRVEELQQGCHRAS